MRFQFGAVGQVNRVRGDIVNGGRAVVARLRAAQRGILAWSEAPG